jgi:dipeptidyl aminopeptidase/acylaminoacyl peptidase
LALTGATALWTVSSPALAALAPCQILPGKEAQPAKPRAITARDLAALRDFGGMQFDIYPSPPAVLSPDGRRVALQLRQGYPEKNQYCVAIVVKTVDDDTRARIVADGGALTRLSFDKYGFAGLVSGAPLPAVLRWSPDGLWLAFTRAVDGVLQIWQVHADGSDERQLTHSRVSIEDFGWTADGQGIVLRSRPALAVAEQAIDTEARTGWRYDGRFWPLAGNRPHPSSATSRQFDTLNIRAGMTRLATEAERLVLEPDRTRGWPKDAVKFVESGDTRVRAWLAPVDPAAVFKRNVLRATLGGHDVPCPDPVCGDVNALWKIDDRTVLFLRRAGVARSEMALFRWRIGDGMPRKLLGTDDAWLGCQPNLKELVCTAEGSIAPRRVIGVNIANGKVRTIYDPNPEFAGIRLSRPERLTWRNAFGIETFGDLVLPLDYRAGRKVPLIVVQYESRGFLRGGTADEFPIQLFAANGFAVLSFNRPPWYALNGPPLGLEAFLEANQKDWMDRRSVQSSLETIVQRLIDKGIADPDRIGITGQSDGASTATFALIHSRLFKAAALSTCCEEPSMMAMLGPGFEDWYEKSGYPRYGQNRPGFWEMGSLLPNANSLPRTPLLIQAGEEEYRFALPTYAAVKNAGWPVEMYVFPGEGHVKIQPAHRLAVYERNLAWFLRWFGPQGLTGD